MITLPKLMVAPNGARRTKADHPQLPITIEEIVACAKQCYEAGADGIHAHVRDENGRHVLDVGLYRELIAEMGRTVPDMIVQVTSEAAGIYQSHQQQAIIRELKPAYVSVAMREMLDDERDVGARERAQLFYQWALDEDVTIQHIIYSAEDVQVWLDRVASGLIPLQESQAQLLFVLGRYRKNLESQPSDLIPFIDTLNRGKGDLLLDWAVCAFGVGETDCLLAAAEQGGSLRIGFENSLWHGDGVLAVDNVERVKHLRSKLHPSGINEKT